MLSTNLIGLQFPMQDDEKGDLAKVSGLDLEKSDLQLLLGIERGELEWDHAKGTRMRELIHSHVGSDTIARAIAFREATDQVNTYAPAYLVQNASVKFFSNMVAISFSYRERVKINADARIVTIEVNR